MTALPPFYGNFRDIKEEHLLRSFQFQHYKFFLIRTPLGLLQDFTTHINACTALCGLHSRLALEEMQKAENLENLFVLISPRPVLILGPKDVFTIILGATLILDVFMLV